MAMVDLTRLTRSAALSPFAALSRLTSFAAPAGLTLFAALVWPLAADAGIAIHFRLDRKIDGPAAPFFLAIDKGYFEAEGLDVTIDAATGGPLEVIDRLTTGAYDMGVADINFLIKFRDGNPGAPIKALFIVFDKPPYAIIARKSRGVVAPKDLEGKKLGAPSTDPAFAAWPIFAKVNGIDAAKVVIENLGLPVREPMLAAGEVDAISGASFTAYVDLKERGVPPEDLVVLLMADYGVELYGDAIVASPKFAQEKPEAARAFLRAYVKALKDAVRDPARAVDAVLRRNDAAKKDIELERLRMAIRDNIVTPAVKADGYGDVDPQRFAAALDQLALTYHFKAKDKAAAIFDPSFLPPAAERRVGATASR
jgi:NitT/TauT family transport system substrate-binding protein